MKILDTINNRLFVPKLTRARIVSAIAVAAVVDALQLTQIPILEQALDVVAMVATTWLIGFHVLLLPTFAIEFIPLIESIPFWTGCVIAVIALRGKNQPPGPTVSTSPPPLPPPAS
jgi:hypothetical protein